MHTAPHATSGILEDGPYRYLRNPLYLGTFLHAVALSLLMSRSGAVFTIVAIGVMQLRLIFGEEAFLTRTLGAPYQAYCARVPAPAALASASHRRRGARTTLAAGLCGRALLLGSCAFVCVSGLGVRDAAAHPGGDHFLRSGPDGAGVYAEAFAGLSLFFCKQTWSG